MDDWNKITVNFIVSILTLVVSVCASAFVSGWLTEVTLRENDRIAKEDRAAAREQHDEQQRLAMRLNELEEERKVPRLELLRSLRFDSTMQATIQNVGARHAAIFAVRFEKQPPAMGAAPHRQPTVATGLAADAIVIDLANADLSEPYQFVPPVAVPPGEIVFLQVKLPTDCPSGELVIDTTGGSVGIGTVVSVTADLLFR